MIGSSGQGSGRRATWRWTSHGDAGRDEDQRRVQQDARRERRRHARRQRRDGHVDAPLGQHLERVDGVAGLEADVDIGEALAEAAQDAGQEALAGGHRGEERDRAPQGTTVRARASAQLARHLVPAIEHVARVSGEARPLGRQAHRAAVALEQAASDLALQALDRARQRRRADVAFAAGLEEAQRARQMQEKAERVVVHRVDRIAKTATVI